MKKTHDYIHKYRGYWSDGGRCHIRIYHEDGRAPAVICTQQPEAAPADVAVRGRSRVGSIGTTRRTGLSFYDSMSGSDFLGAGSECLREGKEVDYE